MTVSCMYDVTFLTDDEFEAQNPHRSKYSTTY